MAIDTKDKRGSVIGAFSPARRTLPTPDGSLNAADREQVGYCYRGIAASPPVIADVVFRSNVRNLNTRSNVIEKIGHLTPESNRLLNPDMLGALFPWQNDFTVGNKYTVERNIDSVRQPPGWANYLGVKSKSSYTVSSTDNFGISQSIYGDSLLDYEFGKSSACFVQLSFWVRSSLTGTFGGAIQNGLQNRSYPFTYLISNANTWEKKMIVVPGDVSGTWETDPGKIGIWVRFGLGAGSSFSGTAGSWSSSDFRTATGATSLVGTSGATLYITGVEFLVLGSSPGEINVSDFGAIGNGVIDDLISINNVFSSAISGHTIVFPPGRTFLVSDAPKLPSSDDVTIIGYGATIKLKNSVNKDLLVSANYPSPGGGARPTIIGLTIDGNSANNSGSGSVVLYGVNGGIFKDMLIKSCEGVGIFLRKCSYWRFENCRVEDALASGFCAYDDSHEVDWVNCHALRCSPGFLLQGPEVDGQLKSSGLRIHGGSAIDSGTGQSGVQVFAGVEGFIISGMRIRGNTGRGIDIDSRTTAQLSAANLKPNLNGIIANCEISNNSADEGIKIWDDGSAGKGASDIIVSGCRIYDDQGTKTQGYGIVVQSLADNILFIGNDLRGNLNSGLITGGSGTNIKAFKNIGTGSDSADSVVVLNDNTSASLDLPGSSPGEMCVISDQYTGAFSIRGGFNSTYLLYGDTNQWSTSSGTASKSNVYYSSGYKIENKTGATRTYSFYFRGFN